MRGMLDYWKLGDAGNPLWTMLHPKFTGKFGVFSCVGPSVSPSVRWSVSLELNTRKTRNYATATIL